MPDLYSQIRSPGSVLSYLDAGMEKVRYSPLNGSPKVLETPPKLPRVAEIMLLRDLRLLVPLMPA